MLVPIVAAAKIIDAQRSSLLSSSPSSPKYDESSIGMQDGFLVCGNLEILFLVELSKGRTVVDLKLLF